MKESIIKHIRKGDRNAFREVFDAYFNALAAFGYNYTQDQDIAEDFAQEAFITLWEKRSDFDHINAVKSYLYTSVRNKCLNHLKHEGVKQKHQGALVYELETEQTAAGIIIEEEVFIQLYNEIKELPQAAQQIMLLTLNGLKNQEIADELGVSINTVKTQKKIGYAKVKDRLGPRLSRVNALILWMMFFL